MEDIIIVAVYHFVNIDNIKELQGQLSEFCLEKEIKGTLLIANEGINGTVAGSREAIDLLIKKLKCDDRFKDIIFKESTSKEMPFLRMKVRLKKEIVTLGVEGIDPNTEKGQYVKPKEWNKLISDPNVMLIDTRNSYEINLGTFKNAVDPKTKSFRDFPKYFEENKPESKDKKVAMFCTGGIRCEKSTAYLKKLGYNNVYHLQGGILKYLEEIPESESLWKGECYVFDQRITVDHNLKQGKYVSCGGCRQALSKEDLNSDNYIQGIQCGYCYDNVTEKHLHRVTERQKQIELSQKDTKAYFGQKYSNKKKDKKSILTKPENLTTDEMKKRRVMV